VGLELATDREDGPLQFGRDAQGDVVVGSRQIVEALGAGLQIAMPPLTEPDLGAAADGGADGLDESAEEAQGNNSMTSREFVVHGYLRAATAGSGRSPTEVVLRLGEGRKDFRGGHEKSLRTPQDRVMCCRSASNHALSVCSYPQEGDATPRRPADRLQFLPLRPRLSGGADAPGTRRASRGLPGR
jgi:hypothetical protein